MSELPPRRRRLLRALLFALLGLAGLLAVGVGFFLIKFPQLRPPSTEVVERTPARVQRGQYLAEHLSNCVACHSPRQWDRFGAPVVPGKAFTGGYCFTREDGLPGTVCPPNLTSDKQTGLGGWTDGEIMRAVREGVSRDGRALFPVMPFSAFASMSDEDVRSVVAYLRSLPPVATPQAPRTELYFANRMLIRTFPVPLEGPVSAPPPDASSALRGEYLAKIGACAFCHSAQPEEVAAGTPVPPYQFVGGERLHGPWGTRVTANLTPDVDHGLGQLDREGFIGRFKSFESADTTNPAEPIVRTPMPWYMLSGLTEEDLGALYDHLRTVPPSPIPVVTFIPSGEGS